MTGTIKSLLDVRLSLEEWFPTFWRITVPKSVPLTPEYEGINILRNGDNQSPND
jgi:hypothetical protein